MSSARQSQQQKDDENLVKQGRIQRLTLGGGMALLHWLFHVGIFVMQLFVIENTAIWQFQFQLLPINLKYNFTN